MVNKVIQCVAAEQPRGGVSDVTAQSGTAGPRAEETTPSEQTTEALSTTT